MSCAALLYLTAAAHAAPPLTLEGALARAREHGPAVRAAALRIDEARARLAGARPLLADNPTVSGGLGRRLAPGEDQIEGHVELVQPLRFGGQRAARIAAAQAAVGAETASAEAARLHIEAQVARAFFRAVAATERSKLAEAAEATAGRSLQALARRHQLGDVPVLDVNVARTAHARAIALVRTTAGARLGAEADLRRLLGYGADEPLTLAGELRDRRPYPLASLLARAQDRPEVRALLAQAQQGQAEADLGRAARWPAVGVGAAYERDEGADVVLGTLSLELPVFARGQELRAGSAARARRLRFEAQATQASDAIAIRAAHAIYRAHADAALALEQALPLAAENDELARKSYEAGQLSLADWLVVRRESLETRLQYLDQLLATAEAGVALATSAGVSP